MTRRNGVLLNLGLLTVLALSVAACGGSRAKNGCDGRVPVNHRPSDAQCSAPETPGDCTDPGQGPAVCATDHDCTAGTNGRCMEAPDWLPVGCFCSYDGCMHDTDCPTGQTCACYGDPWSTSLSNTCLPGNCRVDADCPNCGGGGCCSPAHAFGSGDYLGYFCHTAEDLCIDDRDCGSEFCAYSTTDARWECLALSVWP
jgi:hypothetical protein